LLINELEFLGEIEIIKVKSQNNRLELDHVYVKIVGSNPSFGCVKLFELLQLDRIRLSIPIF